MCGARKHNQAIVRPVKTESARKIQSGLKTHRMDFNSDDSLGRFDVHPGGDTLKETRRTQGTFVYLKGVGIVDKLSFLNFKSTYTMSNIKEYYERETQENCDSLIEQVTRVG